MSNPFGNRDNMPSHPTHKTIGAAIGTALALLAIATALIVAAINPALNGHVIAVATGIGIGVIALVVTIVTVVLSRLRLPSNNDAWVFW
jgi:hypothetical protein